VARFEGLTPSQERGAQVQLALRAAPMFVRGMTRKPFLGTSNGSLFVGRGVRISNPSHIHHDGRLVLEDRVELQGLSRRGIRFGAEVSIGQGTMIRPSSYYGGEVGEGLEVGDRSSMGSGCFIGCSGFIRIGDDVMFGPAVRVYSENHVFDTVDETIKAQGVARGVTIIGNDCWLGSGTIVAPTTASRRAHPPRSSGLDSMTERPLVRGQPIDPTEGPHPR
jgi:acetyltransferase-like isoleucine patch superfamily enzyme